MKKTKIRSKKILSVVLAMLMIMTSVSVCFGMTSAEEIDYNTAIAELGAALKSDTVKNLTSYTNGTHTNPVRTTSGNGANLEETYTTTVTAKDYAQYTEILNLMKKIDNAVKGSESYKASGASCEIAGGCKNLEDISKEITSSLTSSGAMTSAEMSDYQVATLFGILFNMSHARIHTETESLPTKENGVSNKLYNTLVVTTDDYQGYLATLDSYTEVAQSIDMTSAYQVGMSRGYYRITTKTQCGSENTDYYHHVVNKNNADDIAVKVGTVTNTEAKQKIDEHAAYLAGVNFGISYEELLNMVLANTMGNYYGEFTKTVAAAVEYVGGDDTYNTLFGDYTEKIDQLIKSCESAMDAETYLKIAEQWKAFTDKYPNYGIYDYGEYEYDSMFAAYHEFMEIYKQLEKGGNELLNYLNKYGNISLDYYNNFTDNVKVYDLAATAEKASDFYSSTIDTYQDFTTIEKQAAYSLICGYVNSIGTYSEQVVNTIYPDGYDNLLDLQEKLFCVVNEYVVYYTELTNSSYVDMSTDAIIEAINADPEKLAGLNAFKAALAEDSGEERAEELLGAIVAEAAEVAADLYDTLAARFTAEVNFAYDLYVALGEPTDLSLKDYSKLSGAFDNLEDAIYGYLNDTSKGDLLSAETIEKYEYLQNKAFTSYSTFKATFGLSNFVTTKLTYASRDVYVNDQVKTEKYDVKEDKLLDTITKLDSFLAGDKFADLAGIDLGKTITGVLDMVYSDDIINLIVQYLYPLIANEFIKVWDGIDPTMYMEGKSLNDMLNNDIVTIKLNLDTVEKATQSMGLALFPSTLAKNLEESYPEVAATLAKATSAATAENNPWEDSAICDENGKLALKWGVKDKETFIAAADAALSGLEPLLLALLSNQAMNPDNNGVKIGDATASGATATVLITVDVNISISAVNLRLTASANEGYNNLVAPVLEALGVTAPNGNTFTSVADFVEKGLLDPVEALLTKVAKAPVDTVLSILPNLMYALSTDMVTPLLGMLKTNISYAAEADYSYSAAGLVKGSGTASDVLKDAIDINVGDMINLKSMGVDLSKGLQGILDLVGIQIPEIDAITVATLGSLAEIDTQRSDYIYDTSKLDLADGKAYTVAADKAGVAYYVLTYVVELLKNEDALKTLLAKFISNEETVNNITSTIASLGIKSTGDVIASLVELINAEKYEQKTFEYQEFVPVEKGDPFADIDRTQLTPEQLKELEEYEANYGQAVQYSLWWTKEDAEYVSSNLDTFVVNLAYLLGYEVGDVVANLLSNLYTKANLVSLVDLVNGLLAKVDENATIKSIIDIVDPLVNIDVKDTLAALAGYEVPDFEDGDRDAFVNAVVEYVAPIVPVLKLLLVDSADNSELVIADAIEILGYNGYDNALIPILEAIGCDPANITKYADFVKLDDEAMIKAVLNPILALIDKISDDPINGIVGLLPNIVYFIEFGGLQIAVNNILEPVYVVLDVIRPIYDLDLTINLNLDQILSDALASKGLTPAGYSEVKTAIKALGTATEYTSANGKTATYISVDEALTPEFITVLLRTVISTVVFADNVDKVMEYIVANNERLTDAQIENISETLHALAEIAVPDQILKVLYYVFYGLNTGVEAGVPLKILITGAIEEALNIFAKSDVKKYIDNALSILNELNKAMNPQPDPGDDVTPDTCSHMCHKGGFVGFIYKIVLVFWKLFRINQTCACGAQHY
ncbi:MAG: hypothetical protein NC122_04725 [Faecalibacterium sp.]|nr:hypothetical protein [Ruminococcus sp.]MCM1391548.1 hypothetical protein [Ruminococcus sp.]MCM1485489.1 hypothetical protein [Faecalibacterium sp.]